MQKNMTSAQRMPLLLAHLFAAPLVRDTNVCGDDHEPIAIPQQNYAQERDVIIRTLSEAQRGIEFRSEVASANHFLYNLTGCRALHFTWNGDHQQNQVMVEGKCGLATLVTQEWFQDVCAAKQTLPEVVVLTAASAKIVAEAFVRAGISNVIAVETVEANTFALDFVRVFYTNLAQGRSAQHSFDEAVRSIPEDERKRCVLLPDNEDHSASPFNDASRTGFIDRTQQLPRLPFEAATHFRGREVQVQEVYMYMVQTTRVITIRGKPGIGKTEVALRACEYAWERRLFGETFFVPLQDPTTGASITSLKELAARIADAFGFSKEEICEHREGFLGCIQNKCHDSAKELLLVLDGCPPYFVSEKNERINLSSVVERLVDRGANKLKFVITVVNQVGIAREKVVNISRLSGLDAAELFVASASRELQVEELQGGMIVSGTQVGCSECMRLFAGSAIMTALGGHPGAIVSASGMLEKGHLLRHEDVYLQEIESILQSYKVLEQEFTKKLGECQHTQSDFVIDGQWGGRQGRERPRTSHVALTVAPRPNYSNEDGEFWWNRAVNRYSGNGVALANAQTVPWKALCTYSLSEYFLEVLGEHGRERPLVEDEFQALAKNTQLWQPYTAPGSMPGVVTSRVGFLGSFWPWFKAATRLLKRTEYWGFQAYPVICGLSTTRSDGDKLLQGRPPGTFLLRLSSTASGALVVMFVKHNQQVGSILLRASQDEGKFETALGKSKEVMRARLRELILYISLWTHLFPDTPKKEALRPINR
ncbi:unnamed protein product [Ascophyllum nodosum]